MSSDRVFSEELIDKLTCTLELNLGGMIRNLPLPQTSPIHRHATNSSLGRIDTLPPELLLFILNLLDFQSLSRLSRASFRAKAIVEALPAYQELLEHAPDVLVALGRTRILRYHSAALLRQTLRTNRCESCFDFGAFLFLPTCERVCFQCLHENHALRVTTLNLAKKCFHLTNSHLKKIPVLHSIPGTYSVMFHVSRRKVYRLVSVKQVKQLAIEVHGSAENVARLLPPTPPQGMSRRDFWIFKWFHMAPLDPPACDLSRKPGRSNLVEDDFGGMASIRMPSLSGTSADRGRICKGCHLIDRLHSQGSLPTAVLENLVPQGIGPSRPLLALMNRLYSREGFLEHIKTCYGVDRLLAGWGK
ncbi:hypothetical protein GGS23DRAFT_426333 [Durotheca rogersii]|uniref:uncharacterized protein n=1 Tax=Durotheca rogersii TaxID=419775 RepID=UPI002220993A|nr:uncharacterized protein GGS23DRAFT_426333 [Durotheca rogersii]KAI5865425.1 hypothetical protein GGS23DRAFT_426333 [Durotheca rogersii]